MKGKLSLIRVNLLIKLLNFRVLAVLGSIFLISFFGLVVCFMKMIDHQIMSDNHLEATNQFGILITQIPTKTYTAVKGEEVAFEEIDDLITQADKILQEKLVALSNTNILSAMNSIKNIWKYWKPAASEIMAAEISLISSIKNETEILEVANKLIQLNEKVSATLAKKTELQRESIIASQNALLIKRIVDSFYERPADSGQSILLSDQFINDIKAYEEGYKAIDVAVNAMVDSNSGFKPVQSAILNSDNVFQTLVGKVSEHLSNIQIISNANAAHAAIQSGYPELATAVEVLGKEVVIDSENAMFFYRKIGFGLFVTQMLCITLIASFLWFRKKYDQKTIEENHRLVVVELADGISKLAEGDLSIEAPSNSGATGIIADSINFIIMQLKFLIHEINDLSARVAQVSFKATVRARALIKINSDHNRLVTSIQNSTSTLLGSAKEISERATESNQVAKQAVLLGKEGEAAVKQTKDGIKKIYSDVLITENALNRFIEKTNEVQSIIDVISAIGSQTSLLALNAAIKSATIGGESKGFGVVAEEIGTLSDKCTDAARDIRSILDSIQEDTMIVLSAMEETKETASHGIELAHNGEGSLKTIVHTVGKLSDGVSIISQEVNQQKASTESIKKSLDVLQKYSDKILSGTNENDASVKFIQDLSNNLQKRVDVFKLEDKVERVN